MSSIIDLSKYTGGAGDTASRDLPLLSLEQLQQQARAVRWLVKRVLPSNSVGMLFGGSGTFKSFIAIDMALHIAHGLPWLGRKTARGSVLILAAEGGSNIWWRIDAWHRAKKLDWRDAAPFVRVLPVAVDLAQDASLVQQRAAALGMEPALVVVDTMSQTYVGEENSANEVANYLRELGLWFRDTWRACVLIVHHTGHSATERPRGSSAIRANIDFLYGAFRDEKEMLATMECVKQKDGEAIEPVTFQLQVIEVGKDEDGEEMTSLSASAITSTAAAVAAMQDEAQRGRGGRNHLFLELAQNGTEEKKVREAFYQAMDGDAEAKRQAYFRARKWAVVHGLVEVKEGYILRYGA